MELGNIINNQKLNIMKNTLLYFLLIVSVLTLKSQPYGEVTYAHTNSYLSSGTVISTALTPGFVMAGYVPLTTNGNANFYVDRTDAGGAFNSSAWEFQQQYQISGDLNCSSSPSQILDCSGISIIKSNITSPTAAFALVGGMDYGCYFVTLDNSGVPVSARSYKFPAGTGHVSTTMPLITESILTPQTYYIVGSYAGTNVYMLRVSKTGVILDQSNWTTNIPFIPLDIIQSPYNTNDLVIVGHAQNGSNQKDAFFCRMTTNLGAVNQLDLFDISQADQEFASVEIANSTLPTSEGFILGGHNTGSSQVLGTAVLAKTDKSGTLIWYTTIEGQQDQVAGKIRGAVERLNQNGDYEYYGVCATTSGSMIFKLDAAGIPFGTTYPGNPDEFLYQTGSIPECLTFVPNTASNDVGLHIYGNSSSNSGSYYFAESYFSGHTGCNTPVNFTNYDSYIPSFTNPSFTQDNDLSPCLFFISDNSSSGFSYVCGPNTSVTGASNNRSTGILENVMDTKLNVFPIPNSGNFTVKIDAETTPHSEIKLFNELGELIDEIKVEWSQKNDLQVTTLNLVDLRLKSGIYTLVIFLREKEIASKIAIE